MADNVISAGEFLRRIDERSLPRYTCGEAARYLHVPESTVRAWFHGTVYGSAPHIKQFRPILVPSDSELLSFYDIASAHILSAFKRAGVSPADLRVIVNSLKSEFPNSPYPLLGKEFHRFGNDVVLKVAGQILNLNRGRQLGIKKVMQKFLSRIDVDANRMPYRFAPVIGDGRGKGWVIIDPNYGCGRPVVRNTGIPAEIIARRRQSGESVASLTRDYRLSRRAVEEAIKYFEPKAA